MQGTAAVLLGAGLVVVIGGVIALAVASERRRRRELQESCQAAGVEVLHSQQHKDKAAAQAALDRTGLLLRALRRGVKGVNFAGLVSTDARDITILEHSYVVSTGKSHHTVYHSIAAVECPRAWPDLRLKPENFLHKLADFVGLKDIRVESAAFNGAWRVSGSDEEFALTLLTPPIQEKLTAWPKGYWAAIGGGAIAVAANTRLTPERLGTLIRLVTELADLIPAEMEMWGAGEAGSAASH